MKREASEVVAEQDAAYVVEMVAHGVAGGLWVSFTDRGDDLPVFGAIAAVAFGVKLRRLSPPHMGWRRALTSRELTLIRTVLWVATAKLWCRAVSQRSNSSELDACSPPHRQRSISARSAPVAEATASGISSGSRTRREAMISAGLVGGAVRKGGLVRSDERATADVT